VEREAAVLDRLPEPGRQLEPLLRVARTRLVEAASVASGRFRLVHRGVGVLEERLGVRGVEGEEAHPDARADVELGAGGRDRAEERLADTARRHLGRARAGLEGAGEVRHQDEELVAAVASHDIRSPRGRPEPLGHCHQQLVAGLVPEAVVHDLEVVEVHVQHRDGAALRPRGADRLVERRAELIAVREAGERVVVGAVAQLLLRALPLGDVEDHPLGQNSLGVHPRQHHGAILHPAHAVG
jgi:hypothetical protein